MTRPRALELAEYHLHARNREAAYLGVLEACADAILAAIEEEQAAFEGVRLSSTYVDAP